MLLNLSQIDALKDFCALILCGHREDVFQRCKECMESAEDEYGGIPDVLYVLSGNDIDPDNPLGDIAAPDKQLVQKSYLICSDAGALDLEDFFGILEDIKAARGLDFTVNEENFSNNDCIIEWLAELSAQLQGLYIVTFDDASEDYHFTIMNQEDCEKALNAFKRMTAHVDGYSFPNSSIITNDFEG